MSEPNVNHHQWFQMEETEVAQQLQVDPRVGLSSTEAKQRLEKDGPNRLAAGKKETGLQAFLRQYKDFMQIILLVTAIINQVFTGALGTTLVLVGLTVFNAIMGLNQKSKAEASLAALEKMLKNIARVRRDGQAIEVDAEDLVLGDIVLMEAGNRVPADGRLFVAATLEIEEAALTGESVPSLKDTGSINKTDVALGDRHCIAYMNTSVTRGRGEMIVTSTGMNTEIGHIADMLNKTESDKTPLQKQLDRLTIIIASIAGVALILVVVLGLGRGESFETLFITGVALAVAAIPTGLPAVITTLYSMGVRELAKRNAIVKRLPSVETLGSTSAICSDKTGTLTLNKMTAREMVIPGQNRYKITGEGYSTSGQLLHDGGAHLDLEPFLLPMALCADARLDGANLIGDPTEGALIVLAEKGAINVEAARERYPRVAEVPFDSAYKFMATFHNMTNDAGEPVIRCFVKGAPDVLIARSRSYYVPEGQTLQTDDEKLQIALQANEHMAKEGERVMVVARRDFDPHTFNPNGDLISLVNDLTLLAMVGIVDPPRAEAKEAIRKCKSAGIQVRMITGDHAVTAAAIGKELGITGCAITGAEFSAMSDDELDAQLDEIGVIARVAPEDKMRLVDRLQKKGNIVSMTGDGVNDAPALKKADIGVAMGITGTEVTKEAAVMILTDDNFATIVQAVEFGRALYDNLIKYIQFVMATLVGFIASFLLAAIFGVADGIPLNPLQILWINFVIDIPIAVALGFDKPMSGLMDRKPRPSNAPVLSRVQWLKVILLGIIMAVGIVFVEGYFEPIYGLAVATTMGVTALSISHIFNGLGYRSETASMFSRDYIGDRNQLMLYGITVLATLLVTEVGFLNRLFSTVSLNLNQWLICIGVGAILLVAQEVMKIFNRRSERRTKVHPEEDQQHVIPSPQP